METIKPASKYIMKSPNLSRYSPKGEIISLLGKLESQSVDLIDTNLFLSSDATGTWIITGSYDNGFWVHVNEQVYFNTSKTEYPGATSSGHYMKFGKTLINHGAPSADYARVMGYRWN
jgi:hypothetical protein